MTLQETIDGISFLWELFVDAVKEIARALGELIGETIAKLAKAEKARRARSRRAWRHPVNQRMKPFLIDRRSRVYHCRNAC